MNQKSRTARSGIVFLFAVLCIVCLSLSLVLSAHFAAFAEGEEMVTLDYKMNDGKGHDLWLVHYEGQEGDGESLWDGIGKDNNPLLYWDMVEFEDSEGDITSDLGVKKGLATDVNCFTPYRNKTIRLELNPDYIVGEGADAKAIKDLYTVSYTNNTGAGVGALGSEAITSTATLTSKDDTTVTVGQLVKNWKIITLCDSVNVPEDYIGEHNYFDANNYSLIFPEKGSTVVYHITSSNGTDRAVAVTNNQGMSYAYASLGSSGYEISEAWDQDEVLAASSEGNLVSYIIRRLNVGEYTLTITAMGTTTSDGISYIATSVSRDFAVNPVSLGDDNDNEFAKFDCRITSNTSVNYTLDESWNPSIDLIYNGMKLEAGVDYTVTLDSRQVGEVNVRITGSRNLTGYHVLKKAITIDPAENSWTQAPNIITWSYGTYNIKNNLIVGNVKYLENPSDIKFWIVKVNVKDDIEEEVQIEGLTDIHYYIDPVTGENTWLVDGENVAPILAELHAGNYRLYASVYGVEKGVPVTDSSKQRNYQPMAPISVDFTIFVGTNSWKEGSEPQILGWTEGKLDSTDGLLSAVESKFDKNPILIIKRLGENGEKDTLIYSNSPDHAGADNVSTDINVLKGLRAGRYSLTAEVAETGDYSGLRTTVLFDVTPNNLPIWAVVLIVAASLGIVALVFAILHQKGVLQMLTGKVIISMRTRANVDATLAAIRAAKVAREAEASIAAAKAREAEEAAKDEKSDKK